MKKILFIYLFTYIATATEIKNSLNNNHNSVITIVKEALGKDAQEYIVKEIVYEINSHLSKVDKKLLDNKKIIEPLANSTIPI
jgi:hypothetical protein